MIKSNSRHHISKPFCTKFIELILSTLLPVAFMRHMIVNNKELNVCKIFFLKYSNQLFHKR